MRIGALLVSTIVILNAIILVGVCAQLVGLESRVENDLYDITFNPSYAVIVGEKGTVLRCENDSITQVSTSKNVDFYSIDWKPYGDFALICGEKGTLLKYNLNNTLTEVQTNMTITQTFYSIAWNWAYGYALIVGENGTVLKYEEGGISRLNTSINVTLYGIGWKYGHEWEPKGTYALLVGEKGTILKYTHGGDFAIIQTGLNLTLYDVGFDFYGDYGLIVGENGTVFRYDEKALVKLATGFASDIYQVGFQYQGREALFAGEKCYRYDGAVFIPLPLKNLQGVGWDLQDGYGLFVGKAGEVQKYLLPCVEKSKDIFRLIDIGKINVDNNLSLPSDYFFDLAWKGETATIVGGGERNILRWDEKVFRRIFPPVKQYLRGIAWAPNEKYALIVGDGGTVLKYDGKGFSFRTIGNNTLRSVGWCCKKSYALIVGENGSLVRYEGENFSFLDSGTAEFLYDVAFNPDNSKALIVGGNGTVFVYNESNLSCLNSGTSYNLYGCAWKNSHEALIVGERGSIIKYNSGSLELLQTSVSNHLYDIDCSEGHALIVGERGVILKYDTTLEKIESGTQRCLIGVAYSPGGYALILGHSVILSYKFHPSRGVKASLSLSKRVAKLNENIMIEGFGSASNGSVCLIKEYFFDFGDGTNSGWVRHPTMKVRYSESGYYKIKLKVRDIYGYESEFDTACVRVTSEEGAKPSPLLYLLGLVAVIALIYFLVRKYRRSLFK